MKVKYTINIKLFGQKQKRLDLNICNLTPYLKDNNQNYL